MSDALPTVNILLNLALQSMIQGQKISILVAQLQTEGRSSPNPGEWAAIKADRDQAFANLDDIIARAQAEGR